MTFTEIATRVLDRLNLTSAAATTRVGEEINERHREVLSSIGLASSVRATAAASTTIGNRNLTFTNVLKFLSIFDNYAKPVVSLTSASTTATATVTAHGYATGAAVTITGAAQTEYNGNYAIVVTGLNAFTYTFAGSIMSPATGTITVGLQETQRVLIERTFDELRNSPLGTQPPQRYAIARMGATSATIYLDCIPSSVFLLSADIHERTTTLSGTSEPVFSENFHDILVHGVLADELYKMEKYDMSKAQEAKYEKRLGELRLFIAKSAGLQIYQGKTSPSRSQNRLI
jgi:hypothetical protein